MVGDTLGTVDAIFGGEVSVHLVDQVVIRPVRVVDLAEGRGAELVKVQGIAVFGAWRRVNGGSCEGMGTCGLFTWEENHMSSRPGFPDCVHGVLNGICPDVHVHYFG